MTARDPLARPTAEQVADRLRRISLGGNDSTVAMAPLAPTAVTPMATSVMPMKTTQFPPPVVEPPQAPVGVDG